MLDDIEGMGFEDVYEDGDEIQGLNLSLELGLG